MTNPIFDLMINDGPAVFYDFGFKVVLESHLTFFRNHTSTQTLPVTENEAYRFEGDLYGLLHSFNIPTQYHYLIMRMNDFTSPHDATDSIKSLRIPSDTLVENIRQLYQTSHKIS